MSATTSADILAHASGGVVVEPYVVFGDLLPSAFLEAELARTAWRGRRRDWSPVATLWALVDSALAGGASQAAATLRAGLYGGRDLAPRSGALAKARDRLPLAVVEAAGEEVARRAAALAPPLELLDGRPVYLLDGVYLRLLATRSNEACFPQSRSQAPEVGWPLLHAAVLCDLRTGCLVAGVVGNLHAHDSTLARPLWDWLPRGSVVVADCAFASFAFLAYLQARGVDVVVRQHQRRHNDLPLPPEADGDDRAECWPRPRPKDLPGEPGPPWPATLAVRVVRERVGGEVRAYNTTLPAAQATRAEVVALYAGRWAVESRLREVKTELGAGLLAVTTPARARLAWASVVLAHNLLCALSCQVASLYGLPRARLSYHQTRTLVLASRTPTGSAEAMGKRVLAYLGRFPLPERGDDRWEPRAVKACPRKYRLLSQPRAALHAAHQAAVSGQDAWPVGASP